MTRQACHVEDKKVFVKALPCHGQQSVDQSQAKEKQESPT